MMEELIKYLSEKLDVDASAISPTSHLIDDLDSQYHQGVSHYHYRY